VIINGLFLKMDMPRDGESPYVLHYTGYGGKAGAVGEKRTLEVDAVAQVHWRLVSRPTHLFLFLSAFPHSLSIV
jgi:hypothetical protein